MKCLLKLWISFLAVVLGMVDGPRAVAQTPAIIRHIAVASGSDGLQVEIDSSETVDPQTQMVRNPDRIVIDFPGATPGHELHTISVERGEVRRVRVGLFSANPPVTRVVLDLDSPQAYRMIPSGKSLLVKIGHAPPVAAAVNPASVGRVPEALPRLQVSFAGEMLAIKSNKATLAEVLTEIHRKTGAEIAVPAGAEQEQVITDLGPAAARDVITSLLNGSSFNFVLVGTEQDPGAIRTLLLIPRTGGAAQPTGGFIPPAIAAVPAVDMHKFQPPPEAEEQAPVETPEPEPDQQPEQQPPPTGAPPGE